MYTLPSSLLWSLLCILRFLSSIVPLSLFLWPRKVEYRREGWGSRLAFPDGGGFRPFAPGHTGPLARCPSGPLGRPRPLRIEPRDPRSEPRAPKSDPRPPQDPADTTQDRPRAAQEPPRAAQDHPKRSQERPKSPQERPRGGQDLKNNGFSLCFFFNVFENSISATKTAGKSILVPQGPAKSAQEPPKSGQDRPKSAQDRPKTGPRPPQEQP